MKILEKELKEKIKIYQDQDIVLHFKDLFEAKIVLNNIHINYNVRTGFLDIKDIKKEAKFKINIASMYYMDLENEKLDIKLDNSIEILIVKNGV